MAAHLLHHRGEFFHRGSYGLRPQTTALQASPFGCDQVQLTPEKFQMYFRTGWQADLGGVFFSNRTDLAGRHPGIYSLCWCENSLPE
ncbi:unnamed protein product [Symbiodinium natans]|uniref:Uncharacterized protein n=1 Tax=Symbiodinium natans TaxID=878477 RepID=A0A812SID8_9DINO|nr:unnamed protein product [Symbiodinium natans]